MALYFATSNKHKFAEAKEILPGISHFNFSHNEIRSDSLEEIALEAVGAAYLQIKKPVFVEDTGLFVEALNGFPGAFSAWVLGKIGCEGILRLMQSEKSRAASFKTCIAFTDGKIAKTFSGECKGSIANKQHGKNGFGYDPIFVPEGYEKTFAEAPEIKKKVSHRYNALMQLKDYLGSGSADC